MKRRRPGDPEFQFRKHPLRWPKLPPDVRDGVLRGAERARAIRNEIRAESPIEWMPNLRIFPDVGWVHRAPENQGGLALARYSVMPVGSYGAVCADLPGPTVLCADDDELRLVLVHEFAHDFYLLARGVLAAQAGARVDLTGSPYDENEHDHALGLPDLWFSPRDASSLAKWNDSRLNRLAKRIVGAWIAPGLPCEEPVRLWEGEGLMVPDAVTETVAALSEEKRNRFRAAQ
jgi:hypothetical protein